MRTWPVLFLGLELEAMSRFAARSVVRGTYIDLQGKVGFASCDMIRVAEMPGFGEFKSGLRAIEIPDPVRVRIRTYKLVRRTKTVGFYEGRNKLTIELLAELEEQNP